MLTGEVIKSAIKILLKGDEQTEKCMILDETDDVDRVLLWENDLQLKKVRKSQYMISQYPTYCGMLIISYCGASGDFHPCKILCLLY